MERGRVGDLFLPSFALLPMPSTGDLTRATEAKGDAEDAKASNPERFAAGVSFGVPTKGDESGGSGEGEAQLDVDVDATGVAGAFLDAKMF